jgi:pimeloyl-ACP methyl ester carboxylesterase
MRFEDMAVIDVKGIDLHYEVQGDGPPLLLVHGGWSDHQSWHAVAPALADSFRVVTYDRRGHSRSERPTTSPR